MQTKLTLRLDDEIIRGAKIFAKENGTSLSDMVENYFKTFAKTEQKIKPTPIVASLSGIIKDTKVTNLKDEYANYLNEKYK